MKLPQFKSKEEKFKFLKENKQLIIDTKKAATKFAECVSFALPTEYKKEGVTKSMIDSVDMPDDIEEIVVKVVINTTNIVDSHDDCHIPGIWKKSLKDSPKGFYLLQEHNMTFSSVISDTVNAYTKKMSWASLGIELLGDTEALIFEAKVSSDRNEFMFNQYLNGWVKEHSVGMRYINLFLCINTTDKFYTQEKANYDKYFPFVANKDAIEEEGYFWAVTEAKIIEGSAVLKGSNYATPTISVNIPKSIEPDLSTQITAAELSLQESRLKTKQLLTQLIKNQI
jgi:hypothetical protein